MVYINHRIGKSISDICNLKRKSAQKSLYPLMVGETPLPWGLKGCTFPTPAHHNNFSHATHILGAEFHKCVFVDPSLCIFSLPLFTNKLRSQTHISIGIPRTPNRTNKQIIHKHSTEMRIQINTYLTSVSACSVEGKVQ